MRKWRVHCWISLLWLGLAVYFAFGERDAAMFGALILSTMHQFRDEDGK